MYKPVVDIRFTEIFDKLLQDLERLSFNDDGKIDVFKKALQLCNAGLEQLDQLLSNYEFANDQEEIYFFKNFKPQFLSRQFYYNFLLVYEIRKPIGGGEIAQAYYRKTLEKLHSFLQSHSDFYQYYRSGATYLDHTLFKRYLYADIEIFPFICYGVNKHCSTKYEILLAKMLANELITAHILDDRDTGVAHMDTVKTAVQNKITWSASKVALAELLYALHAAGVLSSSPIEIKVLSNIATNVFDVPMGNIYKVFEEIRLRKKNRTAFLDQLKVSLIQRMDMDDDKSL